MVEVLDDYSDRFNAINVNIDALIEEKQFGFVNSGTITY